MDVEIVNRLYKARSILDLLKLVALMVITISIFEIHSIATWLLIAFFFYVCINLTCKRKMKDLVESDLKFEDIKPFDLSLFSLGLLFWFIHDNVFQGILLLIVVLVEYIVLFRFKAGLKNRMSGK